MDFQEPRILTISDKRGIHNKDADGNLLYRKQKSVHRENDKGEKLYLDADGKETTIAENNTPIIDYLYLDGKGAETTKVTGVPAEETTIERTGVADLGEEPYVRTSLIKSATVLGRTTILKDGAITTKVRVEIYHADGVTNELHYYYVAGVSKLSDGELLNQFLDTLNLS